jgi:DNA adenine methylase
VNAPLAVAPTRPIVRWHGGKWRLAPWIISHFGDHRTYVEPFGGGWSVGLRKPRTYAEIWNDLDGELVNLFGILRDPSLSAALVRQLRLTPFARDEFYTAYTLSGDPLERAICRKHDSPATLHYVDPPYLHVTRSRANRRPDSGGVYRHELTDEEHEALLAGLKSLAGMVVVSGYPSELYDATLAHWARVERSAHADGALERTEVLWLNPAAIAARQRPDLFGALP